MLELELELELGCGAELAVGCGAEPETAAGLGPLGCQRNLLALALLGDDDSREVEPARRGLEGSPRGDPSIGQKAA